ncbi:MAG TPA: DUF5666 domain-containing protein [Casimicrobiaceae bacterium]|nr:DUF5666 domain-containing protein [Casimicrobiaceae bacterium]
MRLALTVWLSFLLGVVAVAAYAQRGPRKIAGDVVWFESGVLAIRMTSGEDVRIKLTDRTRISTRAASDLSHVQQGSFIGATAAPRADGTLVASEVHIFSEAMRGTGEGHRPMAGKNTMTNATVTSISGGHVARSTMTNATVANIADSNGERRLTLTYKGGQKVVVVPSGTPVTTIDIGEPSLLVSGAHVVAYATTQPDGSLTAERVSVGKNGYVPAL